jgi:hypothetical protein
MHNTSDRFCASLSPPAFDIAVRLSRPYSPDVSRNQRSLLQFATLGLI